MTDRRTIRRFAHELYPHPDVFEVQPLDVAVPYLYARMVGLDVRGTDWYDIGWDRERQEVSDRALFRISSDRIPDLIEAKRRALLADALLQGLGGVEAWEWAEERAADESGEIAWERAVHYGVPVDQIKPYPCWEEPGHHDHYAETDAHGWRTVTRVDGRESDCPDCTEPIEETP